MLLCMLEARLVRDTLCAALLAGGGGAGGARGYALCGTR